MSEQIELIRRHRSKNSRANSDCQRSTRPSRASFLAENTKSGTLCGAIVEFPNGCSSVADVSRYYRPGTVLQAKSKHVIPTAELLPAAEGGD